VRLSICLIKLGVSVFCFKGLFLLSLNDLVHELIEVVHRLQLVTTQESRVGRHFEENSCDHVAPVVEQILVVFLDIHQFVNYVHLHVHLLIFHGVLSRVVEVELHGSGGKHLQVVVLALVRLKQLQYIAGQNICLVVEPHLVRSASPERAVGIFGIRIIIVVIVVIAKNHSLELLRVCLLVELHE
jgi:hypothetical protein